MKHQKIILFSLLVVPGFASAFSLGDSTFNVVIGEILSVIGLLIPLMFAVAFIVFFWGLSKFILHSDSKADIEAGKNYMFWGVVALFVLVTFRAIISFVVGDLGFGNETGNGTFAPQLNETSVSSRFIAPQGPSSQ